MAIFPSVTAYKDGYDERVEAAVLNKPITQLKERTDYLKEKMDAVLAGNPFESVRIAEVPLNPTDTPVRWDVVYLESTATGPYYSRALSEILASPTYAYTLGGASSFALGIMTAVSGVVGSVALYGKVDLSGVAMSTMLETDEVFRDGPYYLSTREAGKLTANPKGMAVFIGHFYGDGATIPGGRYAYLAPQLKDLWEAHLHKNFVLKAQPSGYPVLDTEDPAMPLPDDAWTVRGFRPTVFANKWLSGASHAMGDYIVPTLANDNFKYYKCTAVSGTHVSGSVEPDWSTLSPGDTIVDDAGSGNSVTWTDMGFYPLLRLNGNFAGVDGTTYTFTWMTSDPLLTAFAIEGSHVDMSTDNGSDAGSVDVDFYERDYAIGLCGVKIAFEVAGTMDEWENGEYPKFTESYDVEMNPASPANIWTIKIPEQVVGWKMHHISGVMTYAGATDPAREYAVYIFGTYRSPDGRGAENIKMRMTASGDFSTDTISAEFLDINDDTICFVDAVGIEKPAHVYTEDPDLGDGPSYDLWVLVTQRGAEDMTVDEYVPAEDPDPAEGDAWEFPFADEAPSARFEYNIGFDRTLNPYYPPTPLLDAVLEMNGVCQDARDVYETGKGSYRAGYDTVYWYNDVYMMAPWSNMWVEYAPETPLSPEYDKNLMLYTSYMRVAQAGIVTSISPKAGSAISIVDKVTGLPASVGDLEVNAILNLSTVDAAQAGYNVFKTVNPQGQLVSGPVVERIKPGAGISLASTGPAGQGEVTINADTAGLTYGDFSSVMLLNAKQEIVSGTLFPYIKLLTWTTGATSPANVPSGFIETFRVPYSLTGVYDVYLYFTMFGPVEISADAGVKFARIRITGSVADDYSIDGAPGYVVGNLSTAAKYVFDITDDLAIGKPAVGYTAYDLFLYTDDPAMVQEDGQVVKFAAKLPVTVSAGDLVSFMVERADVASEDHKGAGEYTSPLGFVSLKWKLVTV